MSLVVAFVTLTTAINGLLAGLNVDTALVKLPARHRIGASAYATFARGNDLGNGLIVYPVLGISAALFTVLVTVLAFVTQARAEVVLLLSLASLLSLLHTFATTRAAPTMLRLKDATQDDALVVAKLDRFARWHMIRTLLEVPVFFLLLWTLAVV